MSATFLLVVKIWIWWLLYAVVVHLVVEQTDHYVPYSEHLTKSGIAVLLLSILFLFASLRNASVL